MPCIQTWFGKIPWLQERKGILRISIAVICLFIAFHAIMFMGLAYMAFYRTPTLPDPGITYGEFPFRLEIVIDGEHVVIEDTLIAEFVESVPGTNFSPPRRRWRTTLET